MYNSKNIINMLIQNHNLLFDFIIIFVNSYIVEVSTTDKKSTKTTFEIPLTTFETDKSNSIKNDTLALDTTYPWEDTSETGKSNTIKNDTLALDTTYPLKDTSESNYDTTKDSKDDKIPGIQKLVFFSKIVLKLKDYTLES